MTVPVHALTPDQMSAKYDIIFLMTKQQDNEQVVNWLKNYMTEDGVICTAQNGIPELSVAAAVGEERTIGCAVGWGATLLREGVSELTSEVSSLNFGIGRMSGQIDAKIYKVKEVLEYMCPVHIEENFMGMRWAKLMINAVFSGMSAVTGSTFGEAVQRMDSRKCCQKLLKECIDVAFAANIKVAKADGKDAVKIFYYKKDGLKQKVTLFLYPAAVKKHKDLKASMLQDLEKGRKCEVDSINGVVCEFGRKYGLATPYNDRVCEIIHGIEAGTYQCGFEHVRKILGVE